MLSAGAAGNAAAIAIFAATVLGSLVAWRVKHSASSKRRHAIAAHH
jgi:hypothetical protein